jgi:murein L,D-transpeptidase YafK
VSWSRALPIGAAVALGACTTSGSTYAAIDRCLARAGAAWDYRSNACEPAPAGPVDRIVVDKSEHWMAVLRQGRVVREFRVALGRGGLQPKQREGDGRVPEGDYTISGRNPHSQYHLSLRISYPTPEQSAAAAARGLSAGGDIMIHGLPNGRGDIGSRHRLADWTDGCIAVTDAEMDWLYRAVPDGIPVEIHA